MALIMQVKIKPYLNIFFAPRRRFSFILELNVVSKQNYEASTQQSEEKTSLIYYLNKLLTLTPND